MTRRTESCADDGFTLLELVVGLTVMGIFLAIFGGAMVTMYGNAGRAESASNAQTQVNAAFLRLDRQVRYAQAITKPGSAPGADPSVPASYVEFLTAVNDPTESGMQALWCTQLRADPASGLLQSRRWNASGAALSWVSSGTTVASGLTNASTFSLDPAGSTYDRVRLTVDLVSGTGLSARRSTYTFSALNTDTRTVPTTPLPDCSIGRTTK